MKGILYSSRIALAFFLAIGLSLLGMAYAVMAGEYHWFAIGG